MTRTFYSGVVASAVSVVMFSKHYVKASPMLGTKHISEQIRNHSQFVQWSSGWFKDVKEPSPAFLCSGEKIEVLTHPVEFYTTLKKLSRKAKKRITLASLYLGNGDKEQQLVDTIYENLSAANKNKEQPTINVLLECTRGSRGVRNSRTLLLPLVKDFPSSANVALFHTPNLRGLLRRMIPARFNETINVAHLKVYLFDDTLIMSGANLSEDYFTNRQDRYVIFEDCKELCDYFDELVQTVSKFSFQLQADDTLKTHPDFPYHPYKGSKKTFNVEAGKLLTSFMKKYSSRGFKADMVKTLNQSETTCETLSLSKARNKSLNQLETTNKTLNQPVLSNKTLNQSKSGIDGISANYSEVRDTLVFPLLQMGTMGVRQDEHVTRNILACAPPNTDLLMATAYFNLTDDYWNALFETKSQVELLMAHPKAMGFYKAAGMAGGIPSAYSLISYRRFQDLTKRDQHHRIHFHEFHRPCWTFHGKGLWAHLKSEQGELDHSSPLLTLIGSPNFGKRSVYRDMEAQVAIVTVNKDLKNNLLSERDNMWKDTSLVTRETFNDEEDRKVKWWIWGIATFLNELF